MERSCSLARGIGAALPLPRLPHVSEHVEELRRIAASAEPPPPAMQAYLAKVRDRAHTVTDADVDEVKASGCSEDEIFEQTVAVAIGEGLRRLEAALRVIG